MYIEKTNQIKEVIQKYFEGIFYGKVDDLKEAFAAHCFLYGDIKGESYFKSLSDYLEGVKNRQSPDDLNEEFRMEILGIEILGNVAMAKLHVPMLGFNYYDFLSLSLVNGKWKIVNKLFTHVE